MFATHLNPDGWSIILWHNFIPNGLLSAIAGLHQPTKITCPGSPLAVEPTSCIASFDHWIASALAGPFIYRSRSSAKKLIHIHRAIIISSVWSLWPPRPGPRGSTCANGPRWILIDSRLFPGWIQSLQTPSSLRERIEDPVRSVAPKRPQKIKLDMIYRLPMSGRIGWKIT